MECIFCKIINREINAYIIYEDEEVISFLDIEPINEGHILIIPKKHYLDADELPDELLCKITTFSKRILVALKKVYNPDGYSIMQNGGAFNDIGHYHMHIFPRFNGDEFAWNFSDMEHNVDSSVLERLKQNL